MKTTLRNTHLSSSAIRRSSLFFSVLCAASVNAGAVAYWPLAYDNGVRTTTATVFANLGDGGTLDAMPQSRNGADWVAGSDYCPQGTNAFPVGYGVYDPVSGTSAAAATGLYFQKLDNDGPAGALRVADPAALRLSTFTVECFIRTTVPLGNWQCLAVMPGQLMNGSTKVKNCDSWGLRITAAQKIAVRFTKSGYAVKSDGTISGTNTSLEFNAPGLNDGRWHHVAFSVDDATHKAIAYFDHVNRGETTLPESVWYNSGMDLFIGNTPQGADQKFGGSLAHVRISDEVLTPPSFLHFTRTGKAADEDPDALLHLDFEPPAGLSTTQGFFNDAAVGPAIHHYGTETIPATVATATPFPQVYAGLLDGTGRASAYCMTNNTSGTTKNYVAWSAPEDVFTNASFTVECCYKTTMTSTYVPLVRRRGGSNVQFNLGFGGTAGRLSATILEYYASTGKDGAKQINDTVASNDGEWHHAALVVNSATKTATLFKDGGIIGSQSYNGTLVPATTGVCVGGVDNGSNFPGLIDNVRVTMRALTVGEFLRPDHVMLSGKTLAWATFDNAIAPIAPAFALTNGVATAAAADGAAPSYEALGLGERVEDGAGNVLRPENLAVLSCSAGVVKYADNILLPLVREQTIEFRVKAGAQTTYAGIVRCNRDRDSADVPAWGISADEVGTGLRVRCATVGESSWNTYGINEDTGVAVFDGRWHHVALTLSQENGQVTASIHKDYEATPSWTRTVSGSLCYGTGYAPVWVGASSSTTAFFNGQIDELRISRGILAPTELLRRGQLPFTLVIR